MLCPEEIKNNSYAYFGGGGGEGGKRGVLWAMQKLANLLNVDDPVSCLIRAPAHHMLSIPVPL